MAKYPILTDEMFREMMSCDQGIRAARFAVPYGTSVSGINGYYVTWIDGYYVTWHDYRYKYEISAEQRAAALERFEKRKAETIEHASTPGVLTFHAMGMSYEPQIEDGVGNYRIRSYFTDKHGNTWLAEFHPRRDEKADSCEALGWWGEIYNITRTDGEQQEYVRKRQQLIDKYGAWWKIPTNLRPTDPPSYYERIEVGLPFSFGNVLAWINARFKTDYRELFLERYFLECNDVISTF